MASTSALNQELRSNIQKRWLQHWKVSPRYTKTRAVDSTTPSNKWLKLVTSLSQAQASIVMQMCTRHISLNKHLFHIKQTNSPSCPRCAVSTPETIHHFPFKCNHYQHEHHELQRTLHWNAYNLAYLLTYPNATLCCLNTFTQHDVLNAPSAQSMQTPD